MPAPVASSLFCSEYAFGTKNETEPEEVTGPIELKLEVRYLVLMQSYVFV